MTTYPRICSLSFAFCQSFHRSFSLSDASRQRSLPGSQDLERRDLWRGVDGEEEDDDDEEEEEDFEEEEEEEE